MAPGNVAIARKYFAAETRLAARKDDSTLADDVEAMLSTLHPGVVMDLGPLSLSRRGVYRGTDQIVEFARDEMHEAWSEYHIDVEASIEAGDKVVLVYHEQLVSRLSGAPTERHAADVYEVKDGRIVSIRFYREPDEALESVGLR